MPNFEYHDTVTIGEILVTLLLLSMLCTKELRKAAHGVPLFSRYTNCCLQNTPLAREYSNKPLE